MKNSTQNILQAPRVRPASGCAAFTLIEMLVVSAILIILMGLLTPAVTSALDRGRATKCMANLRQIGIAAMNYAVEHDGRLPSITPVYEWNEASVEGWWMSALYNFANDSEGVVDVRSVWRCPKVGDDDFRVVNAITYSSYAPLRPVVNFVTQNNPQGSMRLFQIEHPASVWMFGDAGAPQGGGSGDRPPSRYQTVGALRRYAAQWEGAARPAYRHGRGRRAQAHYVACDGHVGGITWQVGQDINNGLFGYHDPSRGGVVY